MKQTANIHILRKLFQTIFTCSTTVNVQCTYLYTHMNDQKKVKNQKRQEELKIFYDIIDKIIGALLFHDVNPRAGSCASVLEA